MFGNTRVVFPEYMTEQLLSVNVMFSTKLMLEKSFMSGHVTGNDKHAIEMIGKTALKFRLKSC